LDFAILKNREQLLTALENHKKTFGKTIPLVLSGQEIKTSQTLPRENPSNTQQIIANICLAQTEHAEKAIQASYRFFHDWKKVSVNDRAALVDKLAALMRRDRFQLIAEQIHEVGKPWAEADADVAEAIDFCEYYAKHMRELDKPQVMGGLPGEGSHYLYQPRGVAVVIAPWNFPLAILAGMAAAAAVCGNTVIMKPAEQSSVVAFGLMKLIIEAGFPKDTFQFLPGLGEVVGEHLVNHPLTSIIAFTGSKQVGCHILQRASLIQPNQKHIKKCIIEMGGKNAVIVDTDADLDEAVDGILYSSFGFAGQKCSAASRVIVLEDVYQKFVSRLSEAAQSLYVGNAEDPNFDYGPVVDKDSYQRLLSTIQKAKKDFKLLFESSVSNSGYFVGPTIFTDVPADSFLAQDEFFGPIMAVIKAKDLDHAIQIANSTEYGLTGGLFSRSPSSIAKVKAEFEVGNLYINRSITGAMVERHPFGGFKMSGIGSKTGGPDYLKQFLEPRTVTENLMRRGFAPAEN
jgi:RHH-type proline utilization regulon transcriptional repressor/proline dehydrogenase/delta 1-pyrroline-5-carboxylate dehydrogenase